MESSLWLNIAGVSFGFRDSRSIDIEDPGRAYHPFLGERTGDTSVEVHLKVGEIPATEEAAEIFESDRSWSILRDRNGRVLFPGPSDESEKPLWVVCLDHRLPGVEVYMSRGAIRMEGNRRIVSNPFYHVNQLLLMYLLAERSGLLLHSAGAHIRGKGFLFAGKSTAGKTTLSRLLDGREGIRVLSDDRLVVREMENSFHLFGTPWPGEGGFALNARVPLSGIFFLNKSPSNRVVKITPKQTLENLLPVASIPWFDPEPMAQILTFCERIVTSVPAFDLHLRPDMDVVEMLEDLAQHGFRRCTTAPKSI